MLRAPSRVAVLLMNQDKDMPLTRLQLFLYIADHEGCLVSDLMKHTGLKQGTVSRSLALLGERPVRGRKAGFHWVEQQIDPDDPRRHRCYLTPKGRAIISQIAAMSD